MSPRISFSGRGTVIETTTRWIAALSAAGAIALSGWFEARAWDWLPFVLGAVFLMTWAGARLRRETAEGVVLALTYVVPVLFYYAGYAGRNRWLPLLAAVLALTLANAERNGWSLPHAWKGPLVFWTLALAFAWPVVALREIDFDFSLLSNYRLPITSRGISPPEQVSWIAYVAATQLVGLLWIDTLFRHFGAAPRETFERRIVRPLLASALITGGVAVYQWLADLHFLSPTRYARLGRASGTLFDANALGAVAGIWLGGMIALASRHITVKRATLAAVAAATLGAAAWGSASRTGLVTAVLSASGAAYLIWVLPGGGRVARRTAMLGGAVLVVVAVIGMPSLRVALTEHRAAGRILRTIDAALSDGEVPRDSTLRQLIRRDGYGPIADRMIGDHPIVGVGVGAFHALALDFGRPVRERVVPDNAQNWFRHQLAELGVAGSLGWLIWAPMLLASLTLAPRGEARHTARVLVLPIVGIGLVSLVGMPTQDGAVLLTFWTFVFWHARAAERPATGGGGRLGTVAVAAALVLALGYAGLTYAAARGSLRIPSRAAEFDWAFERGFYRPSGKGNSRHRWSADRGTIVFPVEDTYLRLAYWLRHDDLLQRPVHVQLWVDGAEVIDEYVADRRTRIVYVRMRGPRGVLDVKVDRVVRTGTLEDPGRDLGVALADWQFAPAPPAGARVVELP